jgi:type VI secretion system protein ImpF
MAELTTTERLQPSLLDRLTDEEPQRAAEGREQRVISPSRLRECVSRDLSWLLNCVQMDNEQKLAAFPEVAASVVNYGIPDLTGLELAGLDVSQLQQRLRAAILAYEPRLIANTLQVTVHAHAERMDRKSLVFEIRSDMWAQPIPLALYLKTEVDLETGKLDLVEGYL